MMQFENPMTFVRSIKGAAASILWAFLFCRRAMSADELERWTGYGDENVTKGIKLLIDTGWLIARSSRGPWCLADGRQLPLMENFPLPSGDESDFIGLNPSVVVNDDLSLNVPTITTLTTTKSANPILSDSSGRTAEDYLALIKALDEHKIIGTKRKSLIACEWVNADYVQASVKYAKDERIWDNPVGMAITRMLDRLDVPDELENPISEEMPRGYAGSFAELLNRDDDEGEHVDDCGCLTCRHEHPERFCQFQIKHEANRTSRNNVWREWYSTCSRPLKPGQSFCDEHEQIESEEP